MIKILCSVANLSLNLLRSASNHQFLLEHQLIFHNKISNFAFELILEIKLVFCAAAPSLIGEHGAPSPQAAELCSLRGCLLLPATAAALCTAVTKPRWFQQLWNRGTNIQPSYLLLLFSQQCKPSVN